MAFSFGFFNSKGLDRTYTAENFCDYLGSIICNGIQDNYGQKFSLAAASSGLKVTLGTGKAWINGHYFISDSAYSIDLSGYMDESLPRYVGIAIVLNTAEAARNITIEITPGTPAENSSLPKYPVDNSKTRLLMYAVRMNPGATSLTKNDWYDYRDDKNVCGYCQCILGKCEVSNMQYQLSHILRELNNYNKQVSELHERLTEIEEIGGTTGIILTSAGQTGENVYYAHYSNGNLRLYGTGETYGYDLINENTKSAFYGDERITSITIGNGITKIGDQIFSSTENLKNVIIPDTVTEIGWTAFSQSNKYMYDTCGLESITLPRYLTKIGKAAFSGNALTSITIPATVTEIGQYSFSDCCELIEATVLGTVIGELMFTRCIKLTQLTVTTNLKNISNDAFNYCTNLTTIIYDGTIEQWQAIKKAGDWSCKSGMDVGKSGLNKVKCTDGYLQYNEESKAWEEVFE